MTLFKTITTLGLVALTTSCVTNDGDAERAETVENLVQAGYLRSDIKIQHDRVIVGGDAEVSLAASREMITTDPVQGNQEQYRTTNLVSRNLTSICVRGNNAPQFNAAQVLTLAHGLNMAIENYNQLNLVFTLRKVDPGQSVAGCGAIIDAFVDGGNGGVAGFPANGQPFNSITVGIGVAQYGLDVAEHVITHELGHALGFRHSDYYNRSISCGGTANNEGAGTDGAILVPGTPATATVGGSIMNSCFRSVETGEFTASDITALRLGYGR